MPCNRFFLAVTLRIDWEGRESRTRKNNYNYEVMAITQAGHGGHVDQHGCSNVNRLDSARTLKAVSAEIADAFETRCEREKSRMTPSFGAKYLNV